MQICSERLGTHLKKVPLLTNYSHFSSQFDLPNLSFVADAVPSFLTTSFLSKENKRNNSDDKLGTLWQFAVDIAQHNRCYSRPRIFYCHHSENLKFHTVQKRWSRNAIGIGTFIPSILERTVYYDILPAYTYLLPVVDENKFDLTTNRSFRSSNRVKYGTRNSCCFSSF